MSDQTQTDRRPGDASSRQADTGSPSSRRYGAVAAGVLLFLVGYGLGGRSHQAYLADQRASARDVSATIITPVEPATTPTIFPITPTIAPITPTIHPITPIIAPISPITTRGA